MRIRSIKPEFWESDDIAALSIEDRLLFIGLWSYVDDDGTGVDKLNRITADLFAGDIERHPRETFARVSRGLQHLHAAGLIVRYTVEGKDYLAVTNWKKHQRVDRPNKSRHPSPTCENAVIRDTLATPSRHPRETPASGTGEQGNRGTGEQNSSSAMPTTAAEPPREDVEALCTRLRDHIAGNTSKTPTITARWRDAARLLIDRDAIPISEIVFVLDWCQHDEFWKSNILSMPKFREKFPALQIKAHQQANVHALPRRTASDKAQGWLSTVEEAERLMGGGS